jgi:hypothetical protein
MSVGYTERQAEHAKRKVRRRATAALDALERLEDAVPDTSRFAGEARQLVHGYAAELERIIERRRRR